MQTIEVAVQRDHLERLARTRPLLGIAELVWNGLDAEASRVEVRLLRSPLGGVTDVIVRDDGHGFSYLQALDEFGRLGGSWKSTATSTRNGLRNLHGARGEGRFRAFAVGPDITWESASRVDDALQLTRVHGHLTTIGRFQVESPMETEVGPYTQVSICVPQEGLASLTADTAPIELAAHFAVYLSQYPDIEIEYDGQRIDPGTVQERLDRYTLEGLDDPASLIIIEWTPPVTRALHLCTEQGFAIQEFSAGVQAPGFNFTAYVLSRKIGEIGAVDIAVGEMHPDVQPIVLAARAKLREHFRARRNQSRHDLIRRWKEAGVHPYLEEPRSPVDDARREAFEVIAVEVADRLPDFGTGSVESTKLSLRLLSESLEQSPASLHRILDEVLNLGEGEREDFAALLERTTLTSMIKASRIVADRLDFCMALEGLVFDPESRKELLERSQLHRILAEETWLWGEEFNLTVDDESVDAVLREHLSMLGRDELAAEPVTVPEQSSGIVDLMLSRMRQGFRGEREHLVVELKRPSVAIGSEEITQIKKYAYAVAGDPRFQDTSTTWTFWLVANTMNAFAREDAEQAGREFGLLVDKPHLRVWVRRWSQVIEAARSRLTFFQEQLGYTPSAQHAREYLHAKHEQYLPPAMTTGDHE